jgi:hypothetical protein
MDEKAGHGDVSWAVDFQIPSMMVRSWYLYKFPVRSIGSMTTLSSSVTGLLL